MDNVVMIVYVGFECFKVGYCDDMFLIVCLCWFLD